MARRLIGAVVLLLVVAGCGGDPKAEPPPAPSTSPVSTTPTAPAMPSLPAAAAANTRAGAIAFVRYYIEVFNDAQKSGSGAILNSLSTDMCAECAAVVRALSKIYSAGGHIEGGDLRSGPATAEYNGAEQVWLVLVRVDSGPQVVVIAPDAKPTHLPGGSRAMRFTVVHAGQSWKVAEWAGK